MIGLMPFQMYGFSYSMPIVHYFGQMHGTPYGQGGCGTGLMNGYPMGRCGNAGQNQCAPRRCGGGCPPRR